MPEYGIIVQSSRAILQQSQSRRAIPRRENQKPSPYAMRAFRRDNIVGTAVLDQLQEQKVTSRVDTRGPERDREVAGYVRVITGERERTIWPVAA